MRESRPLLTAREREVAVLVAQGFSTREIAVALGMAERTAANHRQSAMRMYGVRNAVQLANALRHDR